jgi:TorA maturation chaperone TorD
MTRGAAHEQDKQPLDEMDIGRANEYRLLSTLLRGSPNSAFLARIAQIRGDATAIGRCHAALAQAAVKANADSIEREYFDLFIGVGRGKLMPYASYYRTGFLQDRPLASIRASLDKLRIERASGNAEPEDHVGFLCEYMAGFIDGHFSAAHGSDKVFYQGHLTPWIGRFFKDLKLNDTSDFYRKVGALGEVFMDIESRAMTMGGE